MTRVQWTLFFSILYCYPTGSSVAADWTTDQEAILEIVAAYTEASHERNLNAYLGFWHTDFVGWHNGDDGPTDYEARSNGLRHFFSATKSLRYELEPMAVQIVSGGNAAIVHYKIRNVLEIKESGEKTEELSYWTDYLVRENDRWLLISDHGGNVPAEPITTEQQRTSNRIDYIEIPVADIQAAKSFYHEVFGWEFVDYGPDYASFNDGRLDGGLRKDIGGGRGGPLIILYDAKLDDKQEHVRDSQGRILKEIYEFPGGRRFHFLDLDGNELAVWSDK